MLYMALRANKLDPLLSVGVLVIAGILASPTSASAIVKTFLNLHVPDHLSVNGTDTQVPSDYTADSIKVKWNWRVKFFGHGCQRFGDEERVGTYVVKYDNPSAILSIGTRVSPCATNLYNQSGEPCIEEIEWTMVGSGSSLVGLQIDFPPEEPYPGYCPAMMKK